MALKLLEEAITNSFLEKIEFDQLEGGEFIGEGGYATSYLLVLDYADGGTLRNYLHSKKKELSWPDKIKLSTEIANGLLALHNAKIVHQDLVIQRPPIEAVLETLQGLSDDTVIVMNEEINGKEYKEYGTYAQVRKRRLEKKLPPTCPSCQLVFDTTEDSDPCIHCSYKYLKNDWVRWTSGYSKIDEWIHKQQVQSSSIINKNTLEFIQFSYFKNVASFDEGGFFSVSSAIWMGGGYKEWNFEKGLWDIGGERAVALKKLFKQSEEIVLKELNVHFILSSEFVCQLYGISLITSTRELVIVTEL
ncbi:18511_t:CDS:2, partial [Racocetra fulgida]